MRKFLAECDLDGVGTLSDPDWQALAQRCNEGVDLLAGRTQWVHSYVTADALLCVYIADESASVAEHITAIGFQCHRVLEVRTTIDPTSAENIPGEDQP